jgi:transposase-like protein
MKPTALNDIAATGITLQKNGNSISIQYKDGAFIIETEHWEVDNISEIEELFNIVEKFKKKVHPEVEEAIRKINEASVKAVKKPKKVRKDQFKTKWTDEQKQRIAKRYQNGEGPTSIAQDYGVTPNTIHQICIRMGVKRGKTTKKAEKPAVKAPVEEKTDQERKQTLKEYREKNPKPWYLQNDKR